MFIGTFAGGYISTKFKFGLRGYVMISLAVNMFTTTVDLLFLVFGCDNSHIVGITGESVSPVSSQCGCNDDIFLVCGDNNVDYRSPCLAGCRTSNNMIFSNCTETDNGMARPGLCDLDCPFFIPFMSLIAMGTFMDPLTIIPGLMMYVRTVLPKDQPVATSTGMVLSTLMGMLPSPLLFGKLVDSACSLWHPTGGYCMLYDRNKFRYHFHSVNLALRACNILVNITMALLIRRQNREQQKEKHTAEEATT